MELLRISPDTIYIRPSPDIPDLPEPEVKRMWYPMARHDS